MQPLSLFALLATLVLLFGFQGEQIIAQPLVIALLAVPILIQVYFNSGLAYLLNRVSGERHCVAGPSALIGASNFFELAVAAAIALFGARRAGTGNELASDGRSSAAALSEPSVSECAIRRRTPCA
jgi:ACR3 family arsenite efflux pump ArsB